MNPTASSTVDINSLLAAMMEKMEVTNQKLFEASGAEYQKLLADVREASRVENQKLRVDVREASRADFQKMQEENKELFEASSRYFVKNRKGARSDIRVATVNT